MLQKISAEILFFIATIVISIMIIWPVWGEFGEKYQFYVTNAVFIMLFFTFTRYIFLLEYVPFSHNKIIKVILFFACIPLFLYMLDGFYNFQRFLDEVGLQEISQDSISKASESICKYTRYQFLFFAAGGLITMILLPMRIIISLWRQYNTNKI